MNLTWIGSPWIRAGRSIFALITTAISATWTLITTSKALGLDSRFPIDGRLEA
jgi:hypothetical protein